MYFRRIIMDSATRTMCFALVFAFLCLVCVGCAAGTAQQPAGPTSAKTKAELTREEKTRAAEQLKARREAAAKAEREAAAKAKREAAAKAKAAREEKARLARLDAEAKKQAEAEIAQVKREKEARLLRLDATAKAQAKKQAEEIKAERARLKRKLDQDKANVTAEHRQALARAKKDKAKLQAEYKNYKETIARLEADYKGALAKLKEKADAQAVEVVEQRKQIEADYQEKVARINVRLRLQREEAKLAGLKLPEDTTPRMTVRELRISGNSLVSTAKLFENMPLVYNASDKPLQEADSEDLYDFRVLHDIIQQPGQPRQVSARTIQGFTRYVLSMYQKGNHAGVYVYVPAEAVERRSPAALKDEILPIEVLEAEVTDITVRTYDPDQNPTEKGYLRASAVKEWSPVKVGQVANQKELDEFVNLLNLNPDRYVSAVVSRGREPESLAVSYDIYEADPWHWFIQADNSGTRERQWNPRIGVINTNLLGIDDTFTTVYQAPWDSDIDDNYSLYGSYDFPVLGPRLRLNIYAGHSEFDISPATGLFGFLGRGTVYGGTVRYNALQADGWFFDVKGTVEHTRSKVTPSLFPSFLGTDINFWLWGGGLDLHRQDDMSDTSVTFDVFSSLGGESNAAEFALARTNSSTLFSTYTASATHSEYLDPNKVGRLSGSFRWIGSDERLVPARMTTFGGMYTVRGYKEYEFVADGGILASAQYEFDLVKYDESKRTVGAEEEPEEGKKPFLKKLAPLAFFDYGRAKIRNRVGTEQESEELCSVGAGTIVELGDNFSGAIYYGYPLTVTNATRRGKGRISVGVMLRW